MANLTKVNKPCAGCGVMMENVFPRREYCFACAKKRRDAGSARYREAHRAPKTGIEHSEPVVNPNRKYCKGCYYWGGGDGCNCCNYIFIEDRRRPCPPGKGSVRKEKRHRKQGRDTLVQKGSFVLK